MHAAANYGLKPIWVNRFGETLEKLPGKPIENEKSINKLNKILY